MVPSRGQVKRQQKDTAESPTPAFVALMLSSAQNGDNFYDFYGAFRVGRRGNAQEILN